MTAGRAFRLADERPAPRPEAPSRAGGDVVHEPRPHGLVERHFTHREVMAVGEPCEIGRHSSAGSELAYGAADHSLQQYVLGAGEGEPVTIWRDAAEVIAVTDRPELPSGDEVSETLRVECSGRERQGRRAEDGEARDAGTHGASLAALFEQVERVLQPRHGGVERRLANEGQLAQELQRVSEMLAGRFHGGIPLLLPAPTLERAPPVRSPPRVDHPTPFDGHGGHRLPTRESPPVDAVSAVREETSGGHGANGRMNVARGRQGGSDAVP